MCRKKHNTGFGASHSLGVLWGSWNIFPMDKGDACVLLPLLQGFEASLWLHAGGGQAAGLSGQSHPGTGKLPVPLAL